MKRCAWGSSNPLMITYHDTEWGVPVHDDRKLFEFLLLDGFQAGVSWSIVLNKRENFRKAFSNLIPAAWRNTRTRILPASSPIPASSATGSRFWPLSAMPNAFWRSRSSSVPLTSTSGNSSAANRSRTNSRASNRSCDLKRIRCDEQGPLCARLQVRRLDDLLCIHASRGDDQRPHRRLFSISSGLPESAHARPYAH